MANLALGLHEQVVTLALGEALARQPELAGDVSGVDPADAPHHLARHLSRLLKRVLGGVGDVDGQVALANQLIDVLVAAGPAGAVAAADRVTPALLRALVRRDALAGVDFPPRPDTPLTQTHLLLNARGAARPPAAPWLRLKAPRPAARPHAARRPPAACASGGSARLRCRPAAAPRGHRGWAPPRAGRCGGGRARRCGG